jgi:hypothetical protein
MRRGGRDRTVGRRTRFHDLDAAKAAGWNGLVTDTVGLTCIDVDDKLDPTQPEAFVYAPNAAGRPKLAALEYIVFDSAWSAHHSDPPELFGHQFALTPDSRTRPAPSSPGTPGCVAETDER